MFYGPDYGILNAGDLTGVPGIKTAATITTETGVIWMTAIEAGSEIGVSMTHADDLILVNQPHPDAGGINKGSFGALRGT